eukprot:3260720-Rhodomonas_salina.1
MRKEGPCRRDRGRRVDGGMGGTEEQREGRVVNHSWSEPRQPLKPRRCEGQPVEGRRGRDARQRARALEGS